MAEAYKEYFSSVYTSPTDDEIIHNSDSNISINSIDLVKVHYISQVDIENSIRKLKASTSAGLDLIPPFVIKANIDNFIYPLLILFNLSLSTGIFPDIWKTSKIIPVYKKGNKSDIKNYRPIAILSGFAKVFESVICNKLSPQIHHLISPDQHGFIKKRSTATNLLCLNSVISNALKTNQQLDVIYTDFSKAFDTVNFEILLTKLLKIGFDLNLLTWLRSYLIRRPLFVKYKSALSNAFFGTSGVPQGSILGPMLFNLFINDIVTNFQSCLLFADDLKIFRCISSSYDCEILQFELNKLNNWCHQNKLFLNIDKCFVLTFTRKLNPILNNYTINNYSISRTSFIKDLGVMYESKFTFNLHVQHITKNANKKLGMLKRTTCNFTDISVLFSLFNSLVRHVLIYNCVIWNPYNKSLIVTIKKILNKFVRYISFKTNNHLPTFSSLPKCTLECRRSVSVFKFFYDILNNNIDCPSLLQLLNLYAPKHITRNNIVLRKTHYSKNYFNNQSISHFIDLVNNLPSHSDIFFDTFPKLKCDIISLFL